MSNTETLHHQSDAGFLRFAQERLKLYLELSKSGIVFLVAITAAAGYLIAWNPETPWDWSRFVLALLGISVLAAGSGALNQIQEWQRDRSMKRTMNRPIPTGKVNLPEAAALTTALLAVGLVVLIDLSAKLFFLGLAAVISYNLLYTVWWKKSWAFAAIPGSIPGALPALMGYTAAHGKVFTPGGVYLFLLLVFWQMPHFWTLALKYRDDYNRGGFPTLPVVAGPSWTVRHIILWSLGYGALALLAPLFLPVGSFYLVIALLCGAKVFIELSHFSRSPEGGSWLRYFLWVNFSLVILLAGAVADTWRGFILGLF